MTYPTVIADAATEWVRDYLKKNGPTPAPKLLQDALAVGITEGTCHKAKARVAVYDRVQKYQGGGMVRLPEQPIPKECIPDPKKKKGRTSSKSRPKVVAVAESMPEIPDTQTPLTEELLRDTAQQTATELSGALHEARTSPVLVQVDSEQKVVHVFVAPGWHLVALDMIPT